MTHSSKLIETLFEQLIEINSIKLLNRALFLLSNKEDAEDMVQEVFLAAYNKRESLPEVQSHQAWLLGILQNKVADMYKERYRKANKTINIEHFFDQNGEWITTDVTNNWKESNDSTEALLDNIEFRKSLYECLEKLPPRWKIAVKLCYLKRRKASEICHELNITASAYWKLLQRSRLNLRQCVEINWFSK